MVKFLTCLWNEYKRIRSHSSDSSLGPLDCPSEGVVVEWECDTKINKSQSPSYMDFIWKMREGRTRDILINCDPCHKLVSGRAVSRLCSPLTPVWDLWNHPNNAFLCSRIWFWTWTRSIAKAMNSRSRRLYWWENVSGQYQKRKGLEAEVREALHMERREQGPQHLAILKSLWWGWTQVISNHTLSSSLAQCLFQKTVPCCGRVGNWTDHITYFLTDFIVWQRMMSLHLHNLKALIKHRRGTE
jgi:hypothetical protein